MSSDSDPIASASKGAVEGTLNFASNKIANLLEKFRNKELVFIQDQYTINIVKEQLKSGEWLLCEKHIKNPEYRTLIKIGLTLRSLEKRGKIDLLENLRTKIHSVYGQKGLHIAQLVQERIFSELIGDLAPNVKSANDFIISIEEFLNEIEKTCIFIKKDDQTEQVFDKIKTRLYANNPYLFIIFSSGYAVHIGLDLHKKIEENIKEYMIKKIQDKKRLLLFLIREQDN